MGDTNLRLAVHRGGEEGGGGGVLCSVHRDQWGHVRVVRRDGLLPARHHHVLLVCEGVVGDSEETERPGPPPGWQEDQQEI